MKRELKKAVTRIRKAQDAVFNNKVEKCPSLSIHCNSLWSRTNGVLMNWWTVFAHVGEHEADRTCRSWTFADDSTPEDIEGLLHELSEYIGHAV